MCSAILHCFYETVSLVLPYNVIPFHIQFMIFYLELPIIICIYPNLAKVNVGLHVEYQGRRSNGSTRRVVTDRQTLPNLLSPCITQAMDSNVIGYLSRSHLNR